MGLAREPSIIGKGEDSLLHRERKQYLQGIHHALSGVEAARVILAWAAQRLEGVKPAGRLLPAQAQGW
jgi:hypothetical protein